MTFTLEVMLRGGQKVLAERMEYPGEPNAWTAADLQALMRGMLRAIDRMQNPGADPREAELRGLSWIVSPFQEQVVIAFEIPSASAVAGPFDVPPARLARVLAQAMGGPVVPPATVH
jgi:hypothetical protein